MVARARSEARVSLEIQEFLKLIGCSVYSTEQGFRRDKGGTRQSPGIPDLICFGTGPELPFFFCEVKGPKGKLRDSQIAFRAECERMDIPYLVAWDVREVFDFLVEKGVITTP
jgi:hypothetical protein